MAMRRPAEAFPAGEFIKEEMEERGWTQSDLAAVMGSPLGTVSELILGKRGVTPETARRLAAAFGTSPELWMRLDAAYQLSRLNHDDTDTIQRRGQLYSVGPVKELVRRGWVEGSDNVAVLEGRVLRFYGMSSLDDEPELPAFAAKKSTSYAHGLNPLQVAWLRRAVQLARAVDADVFSRDRLVEAIETLRSLMHEVKEVRKVPRILAEAGIRLVVVQPIAGSKIDGACFWVDDRPVVALSLRFDRIDNFWFVLLHELSHVLQGTGAVDTELDATADDLPPEEQAANDFASGQLVPAKRLDDFVARVRPLYSAKRIEAFATIVGVHPALVVGQLQHRGEIKYASFRNMLAPVRDVVTAATLTDGWGMVLPAEL